MFWQTAFTASWLVVGAQAGIGALVAEGVLTGRSTAHLERRMSFIVEENMDPQLYHHVVKRQSSLPPGVVLNADGTINMTAWEDTANQACSEALSKLPESSNPSGTCICYNLPVLDNVTGTFEADLRLYQLSTPTGAFAGIPPQNIQVGLSYQGASVTPVTAQTAQKLVATRQNQNQNQNQAAIPNLRLLQTYLFVGQIDKTKMGGPMNMAELEALIMPTVTLTAVNPSGQTIATNVSSNEAAFVAGVFSQTIIMSDFSRAQAAVDDIINGLQNGTVAFVLPGVTFMVFPIGLVITGAWTVIGALAFGWGTWERMNFREHYRRRQARVGKSAASYRI